jgi:hypothetical protein
VIVYYADTYSIRLGHATLSATSASIYYTTLNLFSSASSNILYDAALYSSSQYYIVGIASSFLIDQPSANTQISFTKNFGFLMSESTLTTCLETDIALPVALTL